MFDLLQDPLAALAALLAGEVTESDAADAVALAEAALVVERRAAELDGNTTKLAVIDAIAAACDAGLSILAAGIVVNAAAFHGEGATEGSFLEWWLDNLPTRAATQAFMCAVDELLGAGLWPWQPRSLTPPNGGKRNG